MLKLKDQKNASPKDKKPAGPPPPLGRRVWEFFKSIVVALAAVIVLNSFVVQSFQVPTGSMENTVMAGELLFVNKFIYGGSTPQAVPLLGLITGKEIEIPWFRVPGFREPERGDVIVFIYPGDRDEIEPRQFQYYLKRCVAVARDTIQIIDKRLLINGAPFDNPPGVNFVPGSFPKEYVDPTVFPVGKPWNRDNYGPLVVPGEGDVIQLTPQNIQEWDVFIRREGHTVGISGDAITIDRKPVTSYTVERDYLFGMCHKVDKPSDCRFWGFIPKEHVIGTPMIVYMSWSPDIPIINLFKKLGSIRFSRIGSIID